MCKFIILFVILFTSYFSPITSFSCVVCNSTDTVKCATDPTQVLGRDCDNSSYSCFTLVKDGITVRGCSSDLHQEISSSCTIENNCSTCSFNRCNAEVFPEHRENCLQCTGSLESECSHDVNGKPKPCPLYVEGDRCYIRKSEVKDHFMRGCLSSVATDLCKHQHDCFVCSGYGCNFLEANSTDIPMARDSSGFLQISLGSLLFLLLPFLKFN